jgi:hypothetical protein
MKCKICALASLNCLDFLTCICAFSHCVLLPNFFLKPAWDILPYPLNPAGSFSEAFFTYPSRAEGLEMWFKW